MKFTILFSTIFLMLSTLCQAQAGLNVYTGISSSSSPNSILTAANERNQGYLIGADARLNSGNMYFMLSGQYHVVNFDATQGGFFSVEEKMTWLKFRFGLGYNLFNFSEKIALRAKTLLSIDPISSVPEEIENNAGITFNAATAGAHVGLGLDFLAFTFDIEYEKGIFNAINMVENSTVDFITAYIGVRF